MSIASVYVIGSTGGKWRWEAKYSLLQKNSKWRHNRCCSDSKLD